MGFDFLKKRGGDKTDPTRYTYDWMLGDESAVFCVDLTLYDHAPLKSFAQLAFLTCRPLNGGAEFTSDERRRIASFAAKFCRNPEFVMAGSVEKPGVIQYYFYFKSRKAWGDLKDASAAVQAFECRAGVRADAEWSTYFDILYPDNAKRRTALNGEAIEKRIKSGDSDAPRRLNLLLAFPTSGDRTACAAAALKDGFTLGESDDAPEGDLPFSLVIHRIAAMKKSDIDTLTVLAVRLAEEFNGTLVNWDCPIVPARL